MIDPYYFKEQMDYQKKQNETHQKLMEEHRRQEIKAKRLIWQKYKNALRKAIENGDAGEVYGWCYARAIQKQQEEAIKDMTHFGTHIQRVDDKSIQEMVDRWQKWYYRICRWWKIDHGWGEAN